MEYKFNDDDDQAKLKVRPEAAPFPDIPAEAPGILTEHKEIHNASPIQDEPTQSDEERAALVAENSGMEFGPTQSTVNEPGRLGDQSKRMDRICSRITKM